MYCWGGTHLEARHRRADLVMLWLSAGIHFEGVLGGGHARHIPPWHMQQRSASACMPAGVAGGVLLLGLRWPPM